MLLLMTVLLYGVCVYLVRGVTLRFFGGKRPTRKRIAIITALAVLWPLWPEVGPVVVIGLAFWKLMDICNGGNHARGAAIVTPQPSPRLRTPMPRPRILLGLGATRR